MCRVAKIIEELNLSHTLKVFERILDGRLRQEVFIGRQQLGFMKGVGTVDGIFSLRQVMEKFRETKDVAYGLHRPREGLR